MNMNKPNTSQIETMLDLQCKLNTLVDKDWIAKRFPYLRAAFVESAEALDHYGWKWWKKQTPDIPQVQIEISDILHFYLSDILLSTSGNIASAVHLMVDECNIKNNEVTINKVTFNIKTADIQTLFEILAATSILRQRNFSVFQNIMEKCNLDWNSLYIGYVSKNILNIFRQDNGYKDGTYKKIWDNREDNEHLHEIVSSLDPYSATFSKNIIEALTNKYKNL
jgi:dimeric dUTPase (all-alpha-NTP-PPase superfamily)